MAYQNWVSVPIIGNSAIVCMESSASTPGGEDATVSQDTPVLEMPQMFCGKLAVNVIKAASLGGGGGLTCLLHLDPSDPSGSVAARYPQGLSGPSYPNGPQPSASDIDASPFFWVTQANYPAGASVEHLNMFTRLQLRWDGSNVTPGGLIAKLQVFLIPSLV